MKQDELKRKIWKNKDILITCGYGIIIFIVWGFIKQLLYSMYIVPSNEELEGDTYFVLNLVLNLVLLAVCLATGLLARKYGKKDKKEKPAIFILSILLSIFTSLIVFIDSLLIFVIIDQFDIIALVSVIMDILFYILVLRVTCSAFKLRKLYKIREANNNEC